MSEMTDEQKKDLRAHLEKNLELLGAVVQHENDERRAVKEKLEQFHRALNEREKILDETLDKKRSENSAALDAQIARLNKFIAENS